MRIVVTADWHVGRVWKNIQRMDETAKALDGLARYVEREKIDLLLMAGDVFDAPNPAADAEKLVFEFFRRLGTVGVPSVVIAGNHDSPGRVDAWGRLTELAGVCLLGRPRAANKGGVQEIQSRRGEKARIAALPFASPGVFVSALELAAEETSARALYAERFKQAVHHLAGGFQQGCINLLMAHTYLDGAVLANSERQVHLGEQWTATPQALPVSAQFVGLGHIHRPQRVEAAPVPTEYAGSLLQLDFGEAGQKKTFIVLDVTHRRPARVEHVAYEGGKELVDLRLTLEGLEARQEVLRVAGWLRLTVPLVAPDPDLGRKVRDLVPNALMVNPELPSQPRPLGSEPRCDKKPVELYEDYYQREHGRPPEPEVVAAFEEVYEQCDLERGE